MNHVIHSSYGLHVHRDTAGNYFVNQRPVAVAPAHVAAFEAGDFSLGKALTRTQAKKRRKRRRAV